MENNRLEFNKNFVQMLRGGVIMDLTTPEGAIIAKTVGFCSGMALVSIFLPAGIRATVGETIHNKIVKLRKVVC